MDDIFLNKVYSVRDVARMCHVSNETIRRWVKKRNLNAYNTTGGLAIKILGKDLDVFSKKMNVFVDWSAD